MDELKELCLLLGTKEDKLNIYLNDACLLGDIDIAKSLILDGANKFNNAFEFACLGGHRHMIDLLISHGADNLNDGLCCACECAHKDIVKYLITKGANDWESGFITACTGGNIDLVKDMFSKIDKTDKVKYAYILNCALSNAESLQQQDIIIFLKSLGAKE